MNILGISDVSGSHFHSCIALFKNNSLEFALSQERLSRIKNDLQFPQAAIQYALDYTSTRLGDIDIFACSFPPFKYVSSLAAYSKLDIARSVGTSVIRHPVKVGKHLPPTFRQNVLDVRLQNGLTEMGIPKEKIKFGDHHRAHAAGTFFCSPFTEALAVSFGAFAPHLDGRNVAGAVYRCKGDSIEHLEDIPMHAGGRFFAGITVALGHEFLNGDGLTMAMAGLGDASVCRNELKKLTPTFDGDSWQRYSRWIDFIMTSKPDAFLVSKSGRKLVKLLEKHRPEDIAAAAQALWIENILAYFKALAQKYEVKNLALAGGIFHNLKLNQALSTAGLAENIFIHPHPGEESAVMGTVFDARQKYQRPIPRGAFKDMGLGAEFSDAAIENALRRRLRHLQYRKVDDPATEAAIELARGKIIGWFQGREEFGPRALGHRCILADPRFLHLRIRTNVDIKRRPAFLPLGAAVPAEQGHLFFENFDKNPYMSHAYPVLPQQRGVIVGAQHVDGTSRVQAVFPEALPEFYRLLETFGRLTGCPVLGSTSLNIHMQPIVHRPIEALDLLLGSELDELFIGSFAVKKIKNLEEST